MPPVILLTFADYRTQSDKHLRELGREQDGIIKALGKAEEAGLCEVKLIADVSAEKLIEAFNKWPVAILHFAGHANGYKLMLKESIEGEGLAAFLSKQKQLQLVFLNACATEGHAQALRNAGVSKVVTTARAINDTTAREFAVDFYTHIGNGKGIDHAFAQYPHRHSMKNTELRGLYWKGMDETFMDGFPWKLHPAQSEGEAWSLSLAADDPLYGLPAIPPRFDLPEDPFRYLHWFERKHAEVFFGRGHQIRQLYEQLGNSPLTLLYGKSGVGKSSLLHAGLFPRLEESHDIEYLRRDPIKGLAVMVTELLGTATELRTVWQKREQKSGKPFLLILDQVEEAFTRPLHGNAHEKELKTLAAQLYQIFGDPLDRPGGHVILAFRKEYYPEINKILREAEVSRSGLFLEPLRRANVMAAVAGLTKNKRLKQAYKLEVEEDLPARIADDLLEDAESAVAPVLQILLTRLWEKAMGDAPHAPAFSHAAYLGLKKEGLLLGDFLDRQLKRLHVLCPEWIESGLVLDMLFRFTTTAGTSARKTWETWKQSYSLDESALTKLKDHLTNCYLLIKVGEDSYQLAHDTLAPLIRVQYELSDRPGQRADRILRGKIRLGKDASQLSNLELTIIEDGLAGRKIYSKEEKALIKKAKTYWQKSDKKEAAEQKVLQSLQTIDTNPSQSFQYAEEAWQLASLPQALRAMHQAYYHTVYKRGDTLFATPLYMEIGQVDKYVDYTCFHPDGRSIWASLKDGMIYRYSLSGDELMKHKASSGRLYSIHFNKKGTRMLLPSSDFTVRVMDVKEDRLEEVLKLEGHEAPAKQAIFSPDEKNIISCSIDGTIRLWDLKGKEKQVVNGHTDRVSDLVFGPDGMLVSASNDGKALFWKERANGNYTPGPICTDTETTFLEHDGYILAVDLHVVNKVLMYGLTASWDRTAKIWLIMGKIDAAGELACYQIQEIAELVGHTDRVHYACFSPDGEHVLTTSWDATIKLWDMQGNCLATLMGHTEGVFSANFSPDGRHIISGSSDGKILLWDLACRPVRFEKHDVPKGSFSTTRTRAIGTRTKIEREFPDASGLLRYTGRDATIEFKDGSSFDIPAPSGGGIESYADISMDSQYILLPNGLRQCKLFDRQGNEIASFSEPFDDMLVKASFSEDGKHVVTLSGNGKAYFWPFLA